MAGPGIDQVSERPLEELVQAVSQQAAVMARAQVDVARRELSAKARQSGTGVAMVGGGAFLVALASGTGTAALILLLAGRSRESGAALGVTGAYAGAGAYLAREGLVRLRETGPAPDVTVPDDVEGEPVRNTKKKSGTTKRRTKPAAKSARKPAARRAPRAQADRARRRAS